MSWLRRSIYSIDIWSNFWEVCTYFHFNPCFPVGFVVVLCSFFLFVFPFVVWWFFFCSTWFPLFLGFFLACCTFLICGYHGVHVSWTITTPTCSELIVIQVQTHSKRSTIFTSLPHILWFWCPTFTSLCLSFYYLL